MARRKHDMLSMTPHGELVALERRLTTYRLGAAVFSLPYAIATPPDYRWMAWSIVATLFGTSFATLLLLRRGLGTPALRTLGVVTFLSDCFGVALTLGVSLNAPLLHAYLLLMIPTAQAALRWGSRGALLTGFVSSGATWWWSAVAAHRAGEEIRAAHIGFRIFVLMVVGGFLGTAFEQLRRADQVVRRTMHASHDVIVSVEIDSGRIVSVNPAVKKVLGREPDDVVGQHMHTFLAPDSEAAALSAGRSDEDIGIDRYEVSAQHADGSIVWLEAGITVDSVENVWFCVARDVTDRRRLDAMLSHQAFHDHLTGLPNRHRLEQSLEHAVQSAEHPALLFIDLDGFKPVNDRLGHERGDELLAIIAMRLQGCTRAGDLVARLGGDEFCILLCAPVAPDLVDHVVARVRSAVSEPVEMGHDLVALTASVGVAIAGGGDDAATLLRRADKAMYRDKARHAEVAKLGAEVGADEAERDGRVDSVGRPAAAAAMAAPDDTRSLAGGASGDDTGSPAGAASADDWASSADRSGAGPQVPV